MFSVVGNASSSRVRRETRGGRDYLVAPATLIVPGVLAGSRGRLYYPPDEVARNPAAWNHTPLVVYHPVDASGRHLSARDPDVLEKQGIGLILRSKAQGKLGAEAWFDVERTRQVDNRVLAALEAGKPIELSTGLYLDAVPARPGSVDEKGRPYDFVARNYRPDHVAILPDQLGACSLNDGCGVLANGWRPVWNHLPGKHDQSSHARKKSGAPASKVAAQTEGQRRAGEARVREKQAMDGFMKARDKMTEVDRDLGAYGGEAGLKNPRLGRTAKANITRLVKEKKLLGQEMNRLVDERERHRKEAERLESPGGKRPVRNDWQSVWNSLSPDHNWRQLCP